jgi:hypothetical protein
MSHTSIGIHNTVQIRVDGNKPLGSETGASLGYTTDVTITDSSGDLVLITAFHNGPISMSASGSIHAEETPDGCATDKIDRAILCLQEAKKELNREEPRMPIADGHIEDAWHAMKQIDTTTWTEDV